MSGNLPVRYLIADALHTQIAKCQTEQEAVAALRIADRLIVASPCQAQRQTIVVISNAKPVPDRIESIRKTGRVFLRICQVNNRGTENRPIWRNANAAGETNFFAIGQIFYRRTDVTVQFQIASLHICTARTDSGVNFVPANGKIVLVQTKSVRKLDDVLIPQFCSPDDVRGLIGKTCAIRENGLPV